jgi:MFS family permease
MASGYLLFTFSSLYCGLAPEHISMILAGADFIIPFYLQLGKGITPFHSGLFMLLYSAMYSLCAPSAGRLMDKPGFRFLNLVSLVAAAAFFIIYALAFELASPVITIIFFSLWGIANAFLITENFRLVVVNTPKNEKGTGSGIFSVANNLSMVFGVCLFQIIFLRSADFRAVFIFAGLLYLLAAIFSTLAEKSKMQNL